MNTQDLKINQDYYDTIHKCRVTVLGVDSQVDYVRVQNAERDTYYLHTAYIRELTRSEREELKW